MSQEESKNKNPLLNDLTDKEIDSVKDQVGEIYHSKPIQDRLRIFHSEWKTALEFEDYQIKYQEGSGSIRLYCPDGSCAQFHLQHLERWLRTLSGEGVSLET